MKPYFWYYCTCSVRATRAGSWGCFLVLLDSYAELIWKPNAKESEWVLAKTQGWPRELIFVEHVAREQVSWVYTALLALLPAGQLCCVGMEMKCQGQWTGTLWLIFGCKRLVYDKYWLWIVFRFLSCSAVLFQAALQQHTNCIFFKWTLLFLTTVLCYWERSIRSSVNQLQYLYQTSKECITFISLR